MPTFTEPEALQSYITEQFEDGSACDLLCVTLASGQTQVIANINDDAPLLTIPDGTVSVTLYVLERTLDTRRKQDVVFDVLDGVVTRSVFDASDWRRFIAQYNRPVRYTLDVTDAAMNTRLWTHFRWLTRLYDDVTYVDYLRDGKLHVFLSANPAATRDQLIDLDEHNELEHAEVYLYSRYQNWSLTYKQVRPRVVKAVVYDNMSDR